MALAPSTIQDILANATGDDIDQVISACNTRRATLRQMDAAALRVGEKGRTKGLSPKYLNGLTGMIESPSVIRLDEASTEILRYSGKRFYVAPGVKEYVLRGIPAGCLENVQ